jgi:hypothetical protein
VRESLRLWGKRNVKKNSSHPSSSDDPEILKFADRFFFSLPRVPELAAVTVVAVATAAVVVVAAEAGYCWPGPRLPWTAHQSGRHRWETSDRRDLCQGLLGWRTQNL